MRNITKDEIKKLQKIEIEMLIEFDRICKKYNLKYVLAGGSCIGAIRHNGFIPWDDDIDIHMYRKDYKKFIEIQKKELDNKYYFQSFETDEDFASPFGKIRRKNSIYAEWISNIDKNKQGIWIDIFPCDNISNNEIIMKYYFIKVFILKMMYSNKLGNQSFSDSKIKNFILKLIKWASFFISTNKCKKKLYKNMTKFNNQKTNKIICYGGRYLLREILPNNYIENRILHKFEEYEFYITKNYDNYLSFVYGNYMELPPKEKRCSEHLIAELKFPEE